MGYRHFGYLTKLTPATKKKTHWCQETGSRELTLSRTNELRTIEDESYLSEVVSSSSVRRFATLSTAVKRALIGELGVKHQMGFVFVLFCFFVFHSLL
jgi:hypothetical protein